MKYPSPLGCGAFAALALFCSSPAARAQQFGAPPPPPPPLAAGTPAPPISSVTLAGKPFSLKSLRGHVAVLDFWATWCESCKAEMPAFDKLQSDYAARGVRVVGISLDAADTAKMVKPTVKKLGVSYTIVADTKRDIAAGQAYNADVLPCVYIVDKHGVVRWSYSGTYSGEDRDIRAQLDKLAAEK